MCVCVAARQGGPQWRGLHGMTSARDFPPPGPGTHTHTVLPAFLAATVNSDCSSTSFSYCFCWFSPFICSVAISCIHVYVSKSHKKQTCSKIKMHCSGYFFASRTCLTYHTQILLTSFFCLKYLSVRFCLFSLDGLSIPLLHFLVFIFKKHACMFDIKHGMSTFIQHK